MSSLEVVIGTDFRKEHLDCYASRASGPMDRRAEDARTIFESPGLRGVVKGRSQTQDKA